MANFDLICLALVSYNKNFQPGCAMDNVAWRHKQAEIIRISSNSQADAGVLKGQRKRQHPMVPIDQIKVINNQYCRNVVGWALIEIGDDGIPIDDQWASSYQHLPVYDFHDMPHYNEEDACNVA